MLMLLKAHVSDADVSKAHPNSVSIALPNDVPNADTPNADVLNRFSTLFLILISTIPFSILTLSMSMFRVLLRLERNQY